MHVKPNVFAKESNNQAMQIVTFEDMTAYSTFSCKIRKLESSTSEGTTITTETVLLNDAVTGTFTVNLTSVGGATAEVGEYIVQIIATGGGGKAWRSPIYTFFIESILV